MHPQPQALQPSQPLQQPTVHFMQTLPQADAVLAHLQMIFASRSSGLPVHFKRLYDKKVSLLGLTALMGLPERQVPPGLAQNWQQVTLGVLQLLVNYREQQVRRLGSTGVLRSPTLLCWWTAGGHWCDAVFLWHRSPRLRGVAQHQGVPVNLIGS